MIGIDISNWQAGITLATEAAHYDFCIVKLTEGRSFEDKQADVFIKQLEQLGKKIGFYHFARPDQNGTISSFEKEAEYFVATLEYKRLIGKGILVLDWEMQIGTGMELNLIRAWMRRVYEISGVQPFLYVGKTLLAEYPSLLEYPIWLANWPTNDKFSLYASNDVMNHVMKYLSFPGVGDNPWKIWQFSCYGRFEGLGSYVDLNYTPMSADDWDDYAKRESRETLSPDMQWCIEHGIIKGYGGGEYRPKQPATREEVASMIRRAIDAAR